MNWPVQWGGNDWDLTRRFIFEEECGVAGAPPLVAFGMLLGDGRFVPARGAMLILLANVVCINLAGVGTFLLQGVRPRSWWEEERARQATRIAIVAWCALLAILGLIVFLSQSSEPSGG